MGSILRKIVLGIGVGVATSLGMMVTSCGTAGGSGSATETAAADALTKDGVVAKAERIYADVFAAYEKKKMQPDTATIMSLVRKHGSSALDRMADEYYASGENCEVWLGTFYQDEPVYNVYCESRKIEDVNVTSLTLTPEKTARVSFAVEMGVTEKTKAHYALELSWDDEDSKWKVEDVYYEDVPTSFVEQVQMFFSSIAGGEEEYYEEGYEDGEGGEGDEVSFDQEGLYAMECELPQTMAGPVNVGGEWTDGWKTYKVRKIDGEAKLGLIADGQQIGVMTLQGPNGDYSYEEEGREYTIKYMNLDEDRAMVMLDGDKVVTTLVEIKNGLKAFSIDQYKRELIGEYGYAFPGREDMQITEDEIIIKGTAYSYTVETEDDMANSVVTLKAKTQPSEDWNMEGVNMILPTRVGLNIYYSCKMNGGKPECDMNREMCFMTTKEMKDRWYLTSYHIMTISQLSRYSVETLLWIRHAILQHDEVSEVDIINMKLIATVIDMIASGRISERQRAEMEPAYG